MNNLNKQIDFKEQRNFYCFTLFICGGPCHLSSYKQCSGTLSSAEISLYYSLVEKSLFYYIIINTNILVFFSKTTECTFKGQEKVQLLF